MEVKESNQQRKLGCRLLLFPLPLQGHVTPMLHLANLLHSKGFSITIIHTRYNALNPANFPHFTFHFLDDNVPEDCIISTTNLTTVISTIQTNCREPFRACLSQLLSTEDERISCLISDPMWLFAGLVAESFSLPRIAMRTGGLSPFIIYEALPSLREKGYFPLPEDKLDELLPELPPLRVRDLPPETHHDLLALTVKETKTSLAMICNSFEELERSSIAKLRHTLPIPIFPIGPMHKYSPTSTASIWTEDQTSLSWLDTQAPNTVLYVSFGSLVAISESEFLEIAWGLANSKQPFLWVVRTGSQGQELNDVLPTNYFDIVAGRGHIVKWAPQLKVLSHPAVGGFWTHCGWNSIVESICEGVPMLGLPFFADQGITARNISDNWKIGIRLEKGMRREDIERAIRKLMVEEEGAEMRNRTATMKEKAELCVMEGSSSDQTLDSLISYLLSL